MLIVKEGWLFKRGSVAAWKYKYSLSFSPLLADTAQVSASPIPDPGSYSFPVNTLLNYFTGEYIKNYRPRYFVLTGDGEFIGYKQKPSSSLVENPENKFSIKS